MRREVVLGLFSLLLLTPTLTSDNINADSKKLLVNPEIISKYNKGEEYKIGLKIGSGDVVLLLYRNGEASSTYKVYTQGETGELIPHRKAPTCQYHGIVIGHSHSSAVISMCDGLRGKIHYGRYRYHIKPVVESVDYHRHGYSYYGHSQHDDMEMERRVERAHQIFLPPVYNNNYTAVGIEVEENVDDSGESHHVRAKRLSAYWMNNAEVMKHNVRRLERRYMEMSVVIDREQHKLFGMHTQRTTDWVEGVVNHISSKFRPFNLIIAMTQLVIWDRRDEIQMPNNYTRVLDSFANYRRDTLLRTKWSDVSILISGEMFFEEQIIGGAFTDQMCDTHRSTNINYDSQQGQDIEYLSTLISHEVGHILGMYHDEDNINNNKHGTCDCPCKEEDFSYKSNYKVPDFCGEDDRCIMSRVINTNYDHWSLCSRRVLEEQISQHRCLMGTPPADIIEGPTCGNAVIEEGETCDCGSEADCPILDPCCEVGTCQLKNTSSCFTGPCCNNECQFQPKDTVCRPAISGMECDFTETCTGMDSACPTDTYIQNGRECTDTYRSKGFCSSSDCKTHQSQCKWLFGDYARVGKEECWNKNSDGNWQGNCGSIKNDDGTYTYIPCKDRNKRCGLLHCEIPRDKEQESRRRVEESHELSTFLNIEVKWIKYDVSYDTNKLCVGARFVPPQELELVGDDEFEGFVDYGLVSDYTSCGEDLFCLGGECTYEEPTTCPSYNGTECGGHGTCNNLNQCHCEEDWGSDLCVEFKKPKDASDYETVIIILVILVILVPLIVGIVVYMVKHKIDVKKYAANPREISRSIRRFSVRAMSRRGSTRSDISVGNVKMPPAANAYSRVPKVEDNPLMKMDKAKKTELRVAPAPPAKPKALPGKIKSPFCTPSSTPNSSMTRLNGDAKPNGSKAAPLNGAAKPNGSKSPPPVPPPPKPAPATISAATAGPLLRNMREGLRPARADNRTHSATFSNVKIPFNTLTKDDKPCSDTNLSAKKKLEAPKQLAGRSRESKKLQISGPTGTNGSLCGLDGRPKSIHSATDINPSTASLDDFSSTRALFDASNGQTKPSNNRWK